MTHYAEGRFQTRHRFQVSGIDISAGPADKAVLAADRDLEIMAVYIYPDTEAGGAFGAGGVAGRVSFDKIATEENAEDPEKLVEYLTGVGHPALEMEPMF